jgi:UDP:flavonoid glycosyltransferase YjiC (YdhE family)
LMWANPNDYLSILQHRPIVFTHGGIGSFNAALRAGCQIFIEPQTPEQLLNAYIAAELKLAYVINSKTFNTYELARLIKTSEKFLQPTLDIPKSWFNGVKSAADLIINNLL